MIRTIIKFVFGSIGLACLSFALNAQQLPQYTQFHRNQAMFNPGATGAYDFLDVTLGSRYQWLGFSNDIQGNVAPRTGYLNVANVIAPKKVKYNPGIRVSQGPVEKPSMGTGEIKHAVGFQAIADEFGAFRNLSFNGTYAIHLPLSEQTNLSFGTRLGLTNHAFLQDKAQVLSSMNGMGTDAVYANFVSGNGSRMFMDINAGIYVYSNRFFVGVAGHQLTRDLVSIGSDLMNADPRMHFDFAGGVYIPITEDLTIMPSAIVKYMNTVPPAIQANLQLEYRNWLWFGGGYRLDDAIMLMVGGNINQRFKIGYSFDYSTSRFNNYSSGGHEIVLGFMLR